MVLYRTGADRSVRSELKFHSWNLKYRSSKFWIGWLVKFISVINDVKMTSSSTKQTSSSNGGIRSKWPRGETLLFVVPRDIGRQSHNISGACACTCSTVLVICLLRAVCTELMSASICLCHSSTSYSPAPNGSARHLDERGGRREE